MRTTLRWLVAVLVTITAFAVATLLCGALVLAHALRDPTVRWGIAGGLGVAVAALAALWGHSFAKGEQPAGATLGSDSPGTTGAAASGAGNTRNKISGGTFLGPVIQGPG